MAVSVYDGSCRISGTPQAVAAADTYTITAVNATGNSSAEIDLSVREPAAPSLSAPAVSPLTVDVSIVIAISISNADNSDEAAIAENGCAFYDGDDPDTAMAIVGGQVNGFEISTVGNSCSLSGSPTSVGVNMLNIGAVGIEGALDIISLSLTVNPAAPALEQMLTLEAAIGSMVSLALTNSGGAPDSNGCSSDVALPSGLALGLDQGGTTCEISGTVASDAAVGDTVINITAANAGGDSTVELTLTISNAAPQLAASSSASVAEGGSLATISLASSAGPINSCVFLMPDPEDLSTNLELSSVAGLSVAVSADNGSCEVSGMPEGEPGDFVYIVQASNGAGESQTELTLTITVAMPAFEDGPLAASVVDGESIDVVISNSGSALDSCAFIDPGDGSPVASLGGLDVATTNSGRDCGVTGSLSGAGAHSFHGARLQ